MKCIICHSEINEKNRKVNYHITYNPETTLYTCRRCNFLEYNLRHNNWDKQKTAKMMKEKYHFGKMKGRLGKIIFLRELFLGKNSIKIKK